ncbi:helix-turn-helix transcriptional regulator [Cohnella nanjingensis]|uniref:AraC family transcriptional regulator n=1 Tax=Cohnella nanjingensis TaxID=1387779 RepID=A0A7X0RZ69_9BACL|nr:AraC family transcriptional regulator [Cohnella nanjingensis]MBB6674764.1 AraC family transcriptional regulator [Cohnella nanjingensis]
MTRPSELREDTWLNVNAYPLNVFRNLCAPGARGRSALYLHWHDHFELIYAVRGKAVFHIDSQPFEAEPGDLLIVPSGALHVGYAAVEEEIEYLSIVFNRSLLGGLPFDPAHERFLTPYLEGQLRYPIRLDGAAAQNAPFREQVHRLVEEFERKPRAYELAVKAHLYLLFTLLSRAYLPERGSDGPLAAGGKRMERFKQLILHIESHYAAKLTVNDAAKLVNLNPYHFCKIFKNATGRTFIDYVNQHRMNVAERLLGEGDLTVTEVAERVGCGNPNYFTKMFKQYKGRTPSQARRSE